MFAVEVTGIIIDGSGYACKDYNHYGIMNPNDLTCTWLPPAASWVVEVFKEVWLREDGVLQGCRMNSSVI